MDEELKRVNDRLATNAQELQEVVNEAQTKMYRDAFECGSSCSGGDENNLVLQLRRFSSLSKSLTVEKEDYSEQRNPRRKPLGTVTQELEDIQKGDQKFVDLISYR